MSMCVPLSDSSTHDVNPYRPIEIRNNIFCLLFVRVKRRPFESAAQCVAFVAIQRAIVLQRRIG